MVGNRLTMTCVAGLFSCGIARAESPETPAPDKSGYRLWRPTPRELRRPMSADRPDVTESPYTVDAGAVQIELSFVEAALNWEDGDTGTSLAAAPMNLKLGLTNRVDVQLLVNPYLHEDEVGGGTADGFGDIGLRLKVNLWGNDGGKTALALLPFVMFPTGSDEVSAGRVEGGLTVPLAVELPRGFGLGLQATIEWTGDDDDDGVTAVFSHTVNLAKDLTERIGVYVELVGEVPLEDAEYRPTFSSGMTFGVTGDLQFDLGMRVGLDNDDTDDLVVFAGMTVRF